MDGEQKLWAVGWSCLASVFITLILSICIKFHMDNRMAFKYGYERVQSYGATSDRWVKVK